MALSCSPSSLIAAAKCFSCIPKSERRHVRAYLLCQVANGGLGNLIPGGSVCSGGTFTLNVKANTTYDITWGVETQVNICGAVYPSTGQGTVTTVFTGACTQMVFTCSGGAVITSRVTPSSKTPVPSNFTWSLSANGLTGDAAWGTVPGFVTQTELWTSTDNVTFALAATVAAPGTSVSVTSPASGAVLYAKIRFVAPTGAPPAGAFTGVLNIPDVTTAAWAATAIANGGAAPSKQRIKDADVFYLGVVADGIRSKILHLNFIDSTDLTAARCPIIHDQGFSIWTFVGGAGWGISNNGLLFNNAGSAFDTGFNPFTAFANDTDAAMVVCAFTTTGGIFAMAGYTNDPATQTQDWDLFPYIGVTTSHYIRTWDNANGQLQVAHGAWLTEGYYCGSRLSATDLRMFHAASANAHAQIGATLATTGGTRQNATCYAVGERNIAGGVAINSPDTCSLVAFCKGLTQAESALLQARFTTFRTAVGGGWP